MRMFHHPKGKGPKYLRREDKAGSKDRWREVGRKVRAFIKQKTHLIRMRLHINSTAM